MRARVGYRLRVAGTLLRAGALGPTRPDRALRALGTMRRWGSGIASGYTVAAIRHPNRQAIVDERGGLTFAEVDRRTNALANALALHNVGEGDSVAVVCRNHRGFVESTVALAKLGANVLYVNTELAAPAVADILARECPVAVIYDEDLAALVSKSPSWGRRFIAWHATGARHAQPTLEQLIARGVPAPLSPPRRHGRHVLLTSGTTGAPKGALRAQPRSLGQAAAVYSKMPLRSCQATVVAAPLFHSWGLGSLLLALPLSTTLVLHRRFDARQTVRAVAQHRASVLVTVPAMLERIVGLPADVLAREDLSSLRVIASSGSALGGELAVSALETFGEVLYNLYGSTEVAWATIARPRDLRAAPGTAGRPPLGTVVKLLDGGDREVGAGERGRVFVANNFLFDGYTDGGPGRVTGGLVGTGDVGHFDDEGHLFLDGREDEMIVSGGENVYPREVEDLLLSHDQVREAAVVGVEDPALGQRLRAFVVPSDGAVLTERQVQELVKARLARYKVPREVIFLRELPRNAAGKVLKRELPTTD